MTGVNKTTAGPRSVSLVQRRLEIENLSFPARFHIEVVACGHGFRQARRFRTGGILDRLVFYLLAFRLSERALQHPSRDRWEE